MARQKKEDATKRTYRLNDAMVEKLARIADKERRTVTAQMEVFLWEKIREYERSEREESPGQLVAVPAW